jgi:hypothetical protein
MRQVYPSLSIGKFDISRQSMHGSARSTMQRHNRWCPYVRNRRGVIAMGARGFLLQVHMSIQTCRFKPFAHVFRERKERKDHDR